jgi:peptidoglycan L-alanyl-D-glutamate endopeptidase CwlK
MKDKISEDRVLLLHPKVKDEVKLLIEQAEAQIDQNLCIRIVQGLRTIDEQNALYAQGRTAAGAIVTNAKGGQSTHNYGTSIDIAILFKDENGIYQYDDKKSWLVGNNHKKIQSIFKNNGWTWGGDFKSLKDFPHFEKTMYSWKTMKKQYDAGDVFIYNKIKYVNL